VKDPSPEQGEKSKATGPWHRRSWSLLLSRSIDVATMTLQAIKWEKQEGRLEILDQKLLPDDTRYIVIRGVGDGWKAINSMQVKMLRRCHCRDRQRSQTNRCFV